MKQQSRLQILRAAISEWEQLPKVSRQVIAVLIVEKVSELGFKETLADEGLAFFETDDHYYNARGNAQKIFRMFGEYDGTNPQLNQLWMLEQAIVAAMPEDIARSYANRLFDCAKLCVSKRCTNDSGQPHLPSLLAHVIKENGEGQIALAELPMASSLEELIKHRTEMQESIAASQNALEVIDNMIAERLQQEKLKVV